MRIVWHNRAIEDLMHLKRFIARDRPSAAAKPAAEIKKAVDALQANPGLGRPGRIHGTREWIISKLPYTVPYRVVANEVQILRVYHQAMQWPEDIE